MQTTALFAILLFCKASLSIAANVSIGSMAGSETSTEAKYAQKADDEKEAKAREMKRRFQEAKNDTLSALDEIEKLRVSMRENTTQDAVDQRVAEFAKRAAKAMDDRRNELVQQFEGNFSVALKAAAKARTSATTKGASKSSIHMQREEARSALSNMRHLDGQLRSAERKHVEAVRRDSEEMSSMARNQARHAENEGERLVRLVRRRADRLDELARKEGKKGEADRLERKADDVMRALEDEAAEGARRVDDRVRDLADAIARDVYSKVRTHQETRDSSMGAVSESLFGVASGTDQLTEISTTTTAAIAGFAGALVGGFCVASVARVVNVGTAGVHLQESLLA